MHGHRYFHVESTERTVIARLTESRLCGDVMAEILRLELSELIRIACPDRLLVDFRNVTMISSSVIAALLALKRKLDRRGIPLLLCGMRIPIREIYRTLRLEGSVFVICNSVEEVLNQTDDPQPV